MPVVRFLGGQRTAEASNSAGLLAPGRSTALSRTPALRGEQEMPRWVSVDWDECFISA